MSLQTIFDAVVATMRAADPALTSMECRLGAEWNSEEGTYPRMVWVPGEDVFDGDPKGGANPQAIAEAGEGFDAYLHGADYDPTRVLREAFVRALHRHCIGSYRLKRGVWPAGNAGLVRDGRLYVLSFTVLVPITKPARPTATPMGVSVQPRPAT